MIFPILEEYLDLEKSFGNKTPVIELKDIDTSISGIDHVVSVFKEQKMKEAVIMSFHKDLLSAFMEESSQVTEKSVKEEIAKDLVAKAYGNNIEVCAWMEDDRTKTLNYIMDYGVNHATMNKRISLD